MKSARAFGGWLFVLLLSQFAVFAVHAQEPVKPILGLDTKEELRELQLDTGRIIPQREIPALYDMVEKVFRRLAIEQEKMVEDQYVPINYIFILDSPNKNAFVYQPKANGVRVSTNLVFVTTAMLRELIDLDPRRLQARYPDMNDAEKKEIEFGLDRLGGILAHELSHPIDKLIVYQRHEGAKLSVEKEYGARASQGLELNTDAQGVLLGRKADLPDTMVLEAQKRTLPTDSTAKSVLAAMGSHPENSLRQIANSMFLTMLRFKKGNNQDLKPFKLEEFNRQKMTAELQKIEFGEGPVPWRDSRDIAETAGRLMRIANIPYESQTLEFNRLLLHLNSQIAKREGESGELNKTEKKLITDAFQFLLKTNDFKDVWDHEQRLKALAPFKESKTLGLLPTHAQSLAQLKFYSDPTYVEQMVKFANLKDVPDSRFGLLMNLINPKLFVSRFGSDMVDYIKKELHQVGSLEVAKIKGRELTLALFPEMITKIVNVPEIEFLDSMLRAMEGQTPLPFFLTSKDRSTPDSEDPLRDKADRFAALVRQTRMLAKMGDANAIRDFELIKELANAFWLHRSDIAMTELMGIRKSANVRVNWELIAEILEMDFRVLVNQVTVGVLTGMNQQNLAVLGRYVQTATDKVHVSIYKQKTITLVQSEVGNNPMPVWYTPAVAQALTQLRLTSPDTNTLYGVLPMLSAVMQLQPEVARENYKNFFLSNFFRPASLDASNVSDILTDFEKRFAQYYWVQHSDYNGSNLKSYSRLALAQAIDASRAITVAQKKLLLRFCFIRGAEFATSEPKLYDEDYFAWTTKDPDSVRTIYYILLLNGIVSSPADLALQLKASPFYKPIALARGKSADNSTNGHTEGYFKFLDRLAPLFIDEMQDATETWNQLAEATEILKVPGVRHVKGENSNTPAIQDIRNYLASRAMALSHRAGFEDRLKLFLDLTATGATLSTDEFFRQHLLSEITAKASEYRLWLKGVLIRDRISSHAFRLELAKMVLQPDVDSLAKQEFKARESLYKLISDLNAMAPQGSIAKDKVLEDIGWALKLRGAALGAFIEDQKSTNWRRMDPAWVNAGSALASGIFKLSLRSREEFLSYLIDPSSSRSGLPRAIVDEMRDQVLAELRISRDYQLVGLSELELRARAEQASLALKLKVEHYLRDASPTERIPLIAMVLFSGPSAMMKQPDYPYNLTRKYLGYTADSVEEQALLSYLSIVPDHEVVGSFAYMLSQSKEEKGSVANLFELFETVGKKFAQLISIVELFGPEVAKETEHIKNRATPMTLFEIRQRFNELVPKEWQNKIEIESRLGAASVKTYSRVTLSDGRKAAMAMQSTDIRNQIATNLELGLKFLKELQGRGLLKESRMLEYILDGLREQLAEEVDFVADAERNAIAAKIVEDYQSKSAAQLNGWTFAVPKRYEDLPFGPAIAFFELAEDAVPFTELPETLQKEIAPMMVRLRLAMLFRYGYFDADPHKGNWLVNVAKKKIYALDFGQLTDFTPAQPAIGGQDPIQVLVDLFMAVGMNNIDGIVKQLGAMVKERTEVPQATAELNQGIRDALAEKEISKKVRGILAVAVESGFHIDRRFGLGALKGLMILSAEQYVNDQEFLKIVMEEGSAWMMRKNTSPENCLIYLDPTGADAVPALRAAE